MPSALLRDGPLMEAVILCGGRGTRLYPHTMATPKPLMRIGNRPILELIIGHLLRFGLRRFVLCLGYQGDAIRDWFLPNAAKSGPDAPPAGATVELVAEDGSPYSVVLVDTGLDAATGSRLSQIRPFLHADRLLVAYGDVLSDVDIHTLSAFHERHGRLATVTAVRPASPFGHLVLDSDARVVTFAEKPLLPDWVSIGFVVLNREVLERAHLDSGSLEAGLFPDLATAGQMLAFRHAGVFEPMDTYADYRRLNRMWQDGQLAWLRCASAVEPARAARTSS